MTDNRTPSAPTTAGPTGPDPIGPPPTAPSPGVGSPTTPTHTDPQARPRDRGRSRRRRRVLAVLGGLLVAVLLAPTPLVRPFADRAARGYGGRCAVLTGVEADPGAWPVVARAVLGRMRGVSTHAEGVRFDNGAVFHDVDFTAKRVNGAPLRFGVGSQDAEIRGGVSSATVRLDDIERSLAAEGVPVDLRADGDALTADVEVPVLGVVPTAVEVVPVGGDLELRFAPFDAFPLPPMTIALPDPIAVRTVEITADGVRVSSTVEGTLPAGEWGCRI